MARRPSAKRRCPDGRRSSPTVTRRGRAVVDLNSYVPYYLVTVNNALSRGASKQYLATFGIGIVEWRVVSMLAIEPDIPASRICEVVALDKAATSRALRRLQQQGFTSFEATASNPRAKTWQLNDAGYALHDDVLAAALERERRLIDGVDPDELEVFLRVIRRMRHNLATRFDDPA